MADPEGEKQVGKTITVVAAVIEQTGRYLIAQRNPHAVFPLMWEFPGGKVEPGEDDATALRREIREELGVDVEVQDLLVRRVHCYEKFSVDFRAYRCTLVSGEPKALHCASFAWVAPSEFSQYTFPPADEHAIALLAGIERADK